MFTPKPAAKPTSSSIAETPSRQTTVSKRRLLDLSLKNDQAPSIQYITPVKPTTLKKQQQLKQHTPLNNAMLNQTPRKLNHQQEKFMTPSARNAINHLHSHAQQLQSTSTSTITHTQTKSLVCQLNSDLPVSIQAYLSQRDTITTPIATHLHDSNYHAITTNERCFVYIKKQLGSAAPFWKEFKVPETSKCPFVQIVPALNNNQINSGLLIVTREGIVVYWSDLNYDESCQLDLETSVHCLERADPIGFLIGCGNEMKKLTLVENEVPKIQVKAVKEDKSVFSYITFQSQHKSGNLVFVRPLAKGIVDKNQRNVLTFDGDAIDLWTLSATGGDKKIWSKSLRTCIVKNYLNGKDVQDSNVQILDLKFCKNGECVVLMSFCTAKVKTNYVLYTLDIHEDEIQIIQNKQLHYTRQAALKDVPTLSIPNGGPICFITFTDVIVIASIERDSTYQQHLRIQDPNTDTIIGIRYDSTKFTFPEYEKKIDFYVLLNVSGLLKLTVDVDATRTLACDYQKIEFQSQDFRSRLEQVVLYSHQQTAYNPFTFDTERLNGKVNEMVLDLSNQILVTPLSTGTVEYALSEKFRKLDDLIFIMSNWGLIDSLETSIKLSLCYNASTVLAALSLWKFQNKFTGGNEKFDILERASKALGFDCLRSFLSKSGHLMENLVNSIGKLELDDSISTVLHNQCLELAINSASEYIKKTEIYKIDQSQIKFVHWTSSEVVAEVLKSAIDETQNLIIEGVMDEKIDAELKSQLAQLVDSLLDTWTTLGNVARINHKTNELIQIQHVFQSQQPVLCKTIFNNGNQEMALDLCVKYNCFEVLASLVLSTKTMQSERIKRYLKKHGSAFVFPLYKQLIDAGLNDQLFGLPDTHDTLLSDFLTDYPQIAWIHDLKIQKYKSASETLLNVSLNCEDVKKTNTMLSLSKLAFACTLEFSNPDDMDISFMESLNSTKQLLHIQSNLAKKFSEAQPKVPKAFKPIINKAMIHLKNETKLSAPYLLDLITLTGDDFQHALFLANQCDSRETLVRRAWLNCEWDLVKKTDRNAALHLKESVLYSLLLEDHTLCDTSCVFKHDLEWVRSNYLLNRQECESVLEGFRHENAEFAKIKDQTKGIYAQMIALINQEKMIE